MSEIKYTTDGRKVVIVGTLNQSTKIVQEVFVDDQGNELPSGENFTVTSLHDSPVKSWKEKRAEEIEAVYKKVDQDRDKQIREINTTHRKAVKAMRDRIAEIKTFTKKISPEVLDKAGDIIANEFTHYIEWSYSPVIRPIDQLKGYTEYGLKAIVLFGKGGDFFFRINQYSDSSGYWSHITTYNSEAEAIEAIATYLMHREKIDSHDISLSKRYVLPLPKAPLAAYVKKKEESLTKDREESLAKAKKSKESIKELKKLMERAEL